MLGGPERANEASVAIVGLWHLGVVIAACLAQAGASVTASDPDDAVVAALNAGRPPVYEPGLSELLAEARSSEKLTFADPSSESVGSAEYVWIAFDTPVDDDDRADVDWVLERARGSLAYAARRALVIVSSQLPVGSVAELERRMASDGRSDLRFACVPENLRLGRALESFRSPDRVVAGVRSPEDAAELERLIGRFGTIEWMRVESAEMTKHALNAFLATSVAFINEIATLCERVGADAFEVARGLKTERRIGPGAYLRPGDAFAGGTLARDVGFLSELAQTHGFPPGVVAGVAASNAAHQHWSRRTLIALLGAEMGESALAGKRIAVWGLTYKPGTDTLRRSSALELCRWLARVGASVRAYDPTVRLLPSGDSDGVELTDSPLSATESAEALVVCTPWPEFRGVPAETLVTAMARAIVLDPGGHLRDTLGSSGAVRYVRVGVGVPGQ
jgi:UDPglucose 6-dehydrogenase